MPAALDAFVADLARFHDRFAADVDALVEATRDRLAALVREPAVLPSAAGSVPPIATPSTSST